ncbi:MAG: hypothetical protein WCX65_17240, partial [bacterium]
MAENCSGIAVIISNIFPLDSNFYLSAQADIHSRGVGNKNGFRENIQQGFVEFVRRAVQFHVRRPLPHSQP